MSNTFASQSHNYAGFRPVYPVELVEFISGLVQTKNKVWDCGTGNGQLANLLVNYFDRVFATDISSEQIANAKPHSKIIYSAQPSEKTNFNNSEFDLITVAQAIHWFNFERFYEEVNRTLKPSGVLAVIGYGLLRITPELNRDIDDLYAFTGPFWDKERKYLDEHYRTIPFPFTEIAAPQFAFKASWTLDHLIGFLNTWSGVKHFIKAECYNPVDEWYPALKESWGEVEIREVEFPLFLRVGKR